MSTAVPEDQVSDSYETSVCNSSSSDYIDDSASESASERVIRRESASQDQCSIQGEWAGASPRPRGVDVSWLPLPVQARVSRQNHLAPKPG